MTSKSNHGNKVIGIYGGTFDPIHLGHLNLALEILEIHHLDEIWFCPTNVNPHKQQTKSVPIHHRLEMVKLAIQGIPNFSILEVEAHREGPSYTIDTLRELCKKEELQENPKSFRLILGDDAIPHFSYWREPEEIIKLAPILIGRRSCNSLLPELNAAPEIVQAIEKGFTSTRVLDISSTAIRKRLISGLYCGHLLPGKVMDYIYANKLYSIQ